MATLSVRDIADRIGISRSSVRNYASQLADWLSTGANPAPGGTRRFTEDDLLVMAFARESISEGLTYDQVRKRLLEGVHLVEEVRVPPPPEPEPELETALVPVVSLQLMRQQYLEELERVRVAHDRRLLQFSDERNILIREIRALTEHMTSEYTQDLDRIEADYQQRLAQLTSDYDQRTAQATQDHNQRIAHITADYNQRLLQLAADHKQRLDQLSADYDQRLAQLITERDALLREVRQLTERVGQLQGQLEALKKRRGLFQRLFGH
jgi:DNA-binding transcriptional MerR regulator